MGQHRNEVAVFTALDGAVLDPKSFEPDASVAAVERLHAAGIPLVPVTVMTLEEIAPVAAALGLHHPMIVEAGGAIARPAAHGWTIEPCGPPAETLLEVIREIEERSGASLLVYSALEARDASVLSGRTGDMLEASVQRCFSEPVVLERGHLNAVIEAAESLGFTLKRGRRFLHLCRQCDEGEAFARVREELNCSVAIAIGGTPVDAGFMKRADLAVIIPGADGKVDRELLRAVPHARIARAAGPAGWADSVDAILAEVSRIPSRDVAEA